MRGKGKRLSLGTILTLCLTVLVTAGSVFLFTKIRSGTPEARMSAQKVINLVSDTMGATAEPSPAPQSTVRTVTVTLPPAVVAEATPAPAATPVSSDEAGKNHSFTLTVGGLMGFQSEISDSVYDAKNKTLDYQPIFSLINSKINADLNVTVFPHVLNTKDVKYADVLVPLSALDGIRAAGFDDVLLNTEHVLDQGAEGARELAAALTERGFSCGGVRTAETQQNRIIQLNGAQIALLAYTDVLTAKGKNTLAANPELLNVFDPETVRQDIQSVRSQGASCVMIFLYWGRSDAVSVTNSQRSVAQSLAEMGADVIIGTRASRVLPMEMLSVTDASGRSRQTLVAYSLGSFLTESREGYDISGLLLHLAITCTADGRVRFDAVEYTPTYIWRQNMGGKMQYRVVCSAEAPPEGMDAKQQEVMGRALARIQNTMLGCPVLQRK